MVNVLKVRSVLRVRLCFTVVSEFISGGFTTELAHFSSVLQWSSVRLDSPAALGNGKVSRLFTASS